MKQNTKISGADKDGVSTRSNVSGSPMTVHRRLAVERKLQASRKMAAVHHAAGKGKVSEAVLQADCLAARQRGGFVKKSLDRLHAPGRKLDLFLSEFPTSDDYPSVDKLVQFATWCSRTRQRRCLAQQHGTVREGLSKATCRNYLSEMKNHLWENRFPAYSKLAYGEQCAYCQAVFEGVSGLYAATSDMSDTDRANQLVAQTAKVCTRQHFYRTEVQQVQDVFISESLSVNWATMADGVIGIVQVSAARIGMLCKDRHDSESVRWSVENPLRLRDVKYDVVPLVVTTPDGREEATSHMQINWRRVKRAYFEVYCFRSAITTNAEFAIRRTTARVTAALLCAGRFKAGRAGLTNEEWSVVIGSGTDVFGGITPKETKYSSWLELVQAVVESGYEYNEEMLDDQAIPHVDC